MWDLHKTISGGGAEDNDQMQWNARQSKEVGFRGNEGDR